MNNEIKEILDNIKEDINGKFEWEYIDGYYVEQIKPLLDYITNLQQQYEGAILVGKELNKENERLKWDKEQLNSLVNSCQEEIRKLKSEKKNAVDFINKHKKEITKEDTTIFNEDREDKSKLKVGTFMWHVDELIDKLNGRSDE